MPKIKLEAELFKNDNLQRRAFSVLFSRLVKSPYLTLGTASQILSGVRIDGVSPAKLDRRLIKQFFSNWHSQGLIKIAKGRVKVGSSPLWIQLLTEEVLLEIADYDTQYWLAHAPHKLGKHGRGVDGRAESKVG